MELKNGSTVHVKVEVPWRPAMCKHCKIFGHSDKDCLSRVAPIETKVCILKKVAIKEKDGPKRE